MKVDESRAIFPRSVDETGKVSRASILPLNFKIRMLALDNSKVFLIIRKIFNYQEPS